jgi:hypothetical protein
LLGFGEIENFFTAKIIEKNLVIDVPERVSGSGTAGLEVSGGKILAELEGDNGGRVGRGVEESGGWRGGRDDGMEERQMQLESSSKQQLLILQEMCGKLDIFKSSLDVLNSRVNNLQSK